MRRSPVTHHVLDDLVFAVLSLHFEEMVAEVKEVEAALLPQQHDDGTAGPVQPIAKALSERSRTFEIQIWKLVMVRKARKHNKTKHLLEHFHVFIFSLILIEFNSVSCLRANRECISSQGRAASD